MKLGIFGLFDLLLDLLVTLNEGWVKELACVGDVCLNVVDKLFLLDLCLVQADTSKQLRFHDLTVTYDLVVLFSILHLEDHLLSLVEILSVACINASQSVSKAVLVLVVKSGEHYVLVWDVDISSCLLKVHGSNVGVGGVEHTLLVLEVSLLALLDKAFFLGLVLGLLLLHCLLELDGARVLKLLHVFDVKVAQAINVDALVLVEVGASDVAVDGDRVVGLVLVLGLDHVKSIGDDVGVVYPPG